MGIVIQLDVSKSVTKEEWEKVYNETLDLVAKFPLAEKRKVIIKEIDVICIVPTKEREFTYGWHDEKVRIGWETIGDYDLMKTSEDYFLPRDLIGENNVDENAGDAILGAIPAYMKYNSEDKRFNKIYDLWGEKTQGEPYHMYLLAIACLIEDRLKSKAFIYGDITGGQCAKAVEIANEYLEKKIQVPDRCNVERLFERISKLEFSDSEKLDILATFYLGNHDDEFGKFICSHFTKEASQLYWKMKFENLSVNTLGFDDHFNRYLQWGFDLEELCGLVNYTDKEGNELYHKFIQRVLEAKLHLKEKDCRDALKIDQNETSPYGIGTLFGQFVFAGARNKKVARYIPIEIIRKILVDEFKEMCDVNAIIDDYLEKEAKNNVINIDSEEISSEALSDACEIDESTIFNQLMDIKRRKLQEEDEKYDITDYDDFMFYEKGDTMLPTLMQWLGKSYVFYHSLIKENRFKELMNKDALARCSWLIEQNRSVLIRDIDWEKIFNDIENNEESFTRYYPMVRVQLNSDALENMIKAMILNDDLYDFCKEISAQYVSENEQRT